MDQQKTLDISELFYSIQGESTYAGYPCVFIRLAGCNLRCNYCDAQYSYEESSQKITIHKIASFIDEHPGTLVEITGGEPLIQSSCLPLLKMLVKKKRKTLIETNGSISLSQIPPEIIIVADIKCPDSGSSNSFFPANFDELQTRGRNKFGSCEIKFVISSERDYFWSKDVVLKNELHAIGPVHFSPVTDKLPAVKLAELLLQDELPVRLQLQLHTILWPTLSRGM